MHVLRFSGLGAVGDAPLNNDPDLRSGYGWFPYQDPQTNALQRMCPSDAVRRATAPAGALYIGGAPGCWIKNSRAWGQRLAGSEFSARSVTQSTATAPTVPISDRDRFRAQCTPLWTQWNADNPQYASCIGQSVDAVNAFMDLCAAVASGKAPFEHAASAWADYVARRCGVIPPAGGSTPPAIPPPQPPGVPPAPPSPPPSEFAPPTDFPGSDLPDDLTQGPNEDDYPTGGDLPVSEGTPTEDKGFLRQVGPIVGIGLLAAIGLTVARKKGKLTKRRRKR